MPTRPSGLINSNPDMEGAGRQALRKGAALIGAAATTKYMRTGGTNVGPNQQTGIGALRRQTGRLARSLTGARSAQPTPGSIRAAPEGVFDLSPTSNGVRLEYGSEVPYAAAHEYGMSERVNVHTHTRQQTHFFGEELDSPVTVRVHAHSRMMNLPERPYLRPALDDTIDDIKEMVAEEAALQIFTDDSLNTGDLDTDDLGS